MMTDRFRTHTRIVFWTLVMACAVVLPSSAQELALGTRMPLADVSLSDVKGGQATLSGLAGDRGTVVVFWSNQCPWVEKYEARFNALVSDFTNRGMNFVLINSNDAGAYPKESAAASSERFDRSRYPSSLTYLSDPDSRFAEAFGAERTPHVYVFDSNRSLVYVGTIDDSPGDPGNVKEHYLRDALNSVVGGAEVAVPTTKAFGCTIKFKG